jgi:hypothetical protein
VNPSAATGANGDFYINTTTSTLFGAKVSGAWPSGTSLIGAQGAVGPAGPSGATGADGQMWNACIPGNRSGPGAMHCLGPYRNYGGTTWFGGVTAYCDAVWSYSDFSGVDFTGSTLPHGVTIAGVNFSGVNLTDATIRGCYTNEVVAATGANFSNATMVRIDSAFANFTAAVFAGANLSNAYLNAANFTNATLTSAVVSSAYLANANFTGANLTGATGTPSSVAGATWSSTTCPNGVVQSTPCW